MAKTQSEKDAEQREKHKKAGRVRKSLWVHQDWLDYLERNRSKWQNPKKCKD